MSIRVVAILAFVSVLSQAAISHPVQLGSVEVPAACSALNSPQKQSAAQTYASGIRSGVAPMEAVIQPSQVLV